MLLRFSILILFVLTACGAPASDVGSATSPAVNNAVNNDEASVALADSTVGLVARVNGVGISQLTYDTELTRRSEGNTAADADALGRQVLQGLIEREIVRQYARANNISASLEEARTEVAALKASLPDAAAWDNFLAMNALSEPEMVNAVLEQLLTGKVREGLFAPLYGDVLQAHARHILVATEAEANTVLTQLQNGANFQELAQQTSLDNGTRTNGGDLGWFTANELIDPRLGEVVFSLQPGAIAGPIPSRVGYHIIQLIETATRPIEEQRMGVLMDGIYTQWLSDQFAAATIERYR